MLNVYDLALDEGSRKWKDMLWSDIVRGIFRSIEIFRRILVGKSLAFVVLLSFLGEGTTRI